MNIFYAPPSEIHGETLELIGQEAVHASKALRYQVGDDITLVDGIGGWYEGKVQFISGDSIQIVVENYVNQKKKQPTAILGMSIIKKRDRLEFAVEKAVELGVKEIALFRSAHTVKQNVRLDRLETIVLSAMKQSLQAWLPAVHLYNNPDEILTAYPNANIIVAHETEKWLMDKSRIEENKNTLLFVGPEGGFSDKEINRLKEKGAEIVSLGQNRLRTETAAITLLNQFHCLRIAG